MIATVTMPRIERGLRGPKWFCKPAQPTSNKSVPRTWGPLKDLEDLVLRHRLHTYYLCPCLL